MTTSRRSLNPWYVIVWRSLWWLPTWTALAVFCVFIAIYTLSIEHALDVWRNET